MTRINVSLGKRSYPVIIEPGISGVVKLLPKQHQRLGRLFVIYDSQVYALYGRRITRLLGRAGKTSEFVVPAGERSKCRAQLNRIHDFLLTERISRSDTIVACGGGMVSDLVGFAAATTQRGIPWIVIPTTLIGMVDAAIGGKTAINHPSGKNLIGAFWQPLLVYCGLEFLMTLPERQMINGLGEILKYAGLSGSALIDRLSRYLERGDLYDLNALTPIVIECVRYKAQTVSRDETDKGQRMVLNLGHTFGHALEAGAGFGRLLHGEALILGLKCALRLSAMCWPAGDTALRRYETLVGSFLPLVPEREINSPKALDALRLDKKRRDGKPKYILLRKPGSPYIADDITIAMARKALKHTLSGEDSD